MTSIVAALRRRPFGERLAKHVNGILTADIPLTRQEVVASERQCGCVFDWVQNLLTPLLSRPAAAKGMARDSSDPDAAEVQDARDRALEAVSEQEKEVARLRRNLQEAARSEQAAAEFALEHVPERSNGADRTTEKLEMTGQKSIQYRLEEVSLPATQEAILHSLLKMLLEPRSGQKRCLEIVGHAEDREASETAKQRAEAAEAWLVNHGVQEERLSVRWEAGGPAMCRRTDLRLLEPAGADLAMRQRAGEVMKRIFAGYAEALEKAMPAAQLETAEKLTLGETNERVSTSMLRDSAEELAQPSFKLEEVRESGGQIRQLRLVFQKAGSWHMPGCASRKETHVCNTQILRNAGGTEPDRCRFGGWFSHGTLEQPLCFMERSGGPF